MLPAFEGALVGVDDPLGQGNLGVRAGVADGVHGVAQAYQGDRTSADVDLVGHGVGEF